MPKMKQATRKNASLAIWVNRAPPSKLLLTLTVLSTTNSSTAMRSSTTSTAVTVEANFCCFSLRSSKLLMMMLVDEMESMQPRKVHSMAEKPRILPTELPMRNMMASSVSAVMAPVAPTFFSFLMLNSRPKPNIRKTMPISLHTVRLALSVMAGNQGK